MTTTTDKHFQPEDVIARYGATLLGEEVVYFPARDPKCLLICFSAMDANNRFNRLSWFWDPEEQWQNGMSVLYLCDRKYQFYLGDNTSPKFHTFEKIIQRYMQVAGVSAEQTFCVGSSMGGYAAILYAFRLRLGGAITGVPQVSKRFARMHNYANWIKSINSTEDQWLELDEFLYRTDMKLPRLYLEYGRYPADCFAAECLLDIYRERNGLVLAHKGRVAEHSYFMSPETVLATVELFRHIKPVDV